MREQMAAITLCGTMNSVAQQMQPACSRLLAVMITGSGGLPMPEEQGLATPVGIASAMSSGCRCVAIKRSSVNFVNLGSILNLSQAASARPACNDAIRPRSAGKTVAASPDRAHCGSLGQRRLFLRHTPQHGDQFAGLLRCPVKMSHHRDLLLDAALLVVPAGA